MSNGIYFVGVDKSITGFAISVIDQNGEQCGELLIDSEKNSTRDMVYRIYSLVRQAMGFIRNYGPSVSIYIEDMSHRSQGQSTLDLAGLHYHFLCKLLEHSLLDKSVLVAPQSLKAFMLGKGGGKGSKKGFIALQCYKTFGVEFDNDDLCDAYCLAQLAKEVYEKCREKEECSGEKKRVGKSRKSKSGKRKLKLRKSKKRCVARFAIKSIR